MNILNSVWSKFTKHYNKQHEQPLVVAALPIYLFTSIVAKAASISALLKTPSISVATGKIPLRAAVNDCTHERSHHTPELTVNTDQLKKAL